MSYEKTEVTIPNLESTLNALPVPDATSATLASLLSSGITVTLDDDSGVWVACVAQDDPETPSVEFVVCAIAGDASGVKTWPSLRPIASTFIHPVSPDVVASLGVNAVRKDLMLIALGEPTEHPDDWAAMANSDRSIRTQILAASQVAAEPTDVL